MATPRERIQQSPLLDAGLVTIAALVMYALTRAPGLMYTDAGELAAVAHTFGVAHPTGYPLFTLLTHSWTLLFHGIGALNMLAEIWVSASVGVLYLAFARTVALLRNEATASTSTRISAAGSALLFAFSSVAWSQATSIEVYSLQTLLIALTLLTTVNSIVYDNRWLQWSALAGLFAGFMMANHASSVFLLLGFLLLWFSAKREQQYRALHILVLPSLVGLALYAILPLRSAHHPEMNWGMVHRGWDAFLYHVKGTQFGVWMFSEPAAVKTNWTVFRKLLVDMLVWAGFIPLAWGLWHAVRTHTRIAFGLLVIIAGNLGISLGYGIPDIEPYFLASFIILGMFLTIGIRELLQRIPRKLAGIVFALPLIAAAAHYTANDKSTHAAVPGYTTWLLANAEPNAIIITRQWDYFCSAAWYLQTVEHVRTDVTIIDKELLRRTWYAPFLQQHYPAAIGKIQPEVDAYMPLLQEFELDSKAFMASGKSGNIQAKFVELLNAIIERNRDRPIYITPELINEEEGFAGGWQKIPAGPMVRLLPPGISYTQRESLDGLNAMISTLQNPKERLDSALRETALSGIASMAFYKLDAKLDTNSFRSYRDAAVRLHPTSPITMQLLGTRY